MVYDTQTSRLLLFGGFDTYANTLGDLWSAAGTTWTAASPPARSDGAIAYDTATNQVVLYGGLDVNGNTLGDTWVLTGATWSAVKTASAPTARAYTQMAYDPVTSEVLLFGGLDNNFDTFGDEWTYSAAGWSPETTTPLPSARSDANIAFDPTSSQLVLFGGLDVNGSALADTWTTVSNLPGAPTNLTASLGIGQANLSWSAPGNGGSPITSYTVAITDTTTSSTLPPVTVPGSPPPTGTPLTGLTPGHAYSFSVSAANAVGTGPSSALAERMPAPFFPVAPARICDTRTGNSTQCAGKTLHAGSTLAVQVTGKGEVPSGATAVVANVTVTNPTATSYLTAYPAGTTRPVASNLNFAAGQTVPNLVTVPLSASGVLDLFNAAGSTDVIVDVTGYYGPGPGQGFTSLSPARICDTRSGNSTQCAGKTVGPGSVVTLQVTGVGGVPPGATAVVANVTVTNPTATSYLTAYPEGSPRPLASNLNFTAKQTVPNRVIVPLLSSGALSIFNAAGSTDVIVDVTGYYSGTTSGYFAPLSPARICDTRTGNATPCVGKTLGSGSTLTVQVTGKGGVPAGAAAVVANVTATGATSTSYLTVWPAGTTRPVASDLNFAVGQTVPNLVVAKLSSSGGLGVFNAGGSVDVIVDVGGWFTP